MLTILRRFIGNPHGKISVKNRLNSGSLFDLRQRLKFVFLRQFFDKKHCSTNESGWNWL